LFTPTAAVFVEVGKSNTLRDSKLAADATAYTGYIGKNQIQKYWNWILFEQETHA
jgi:hypothetical protein